MNIPNLKKRMNGKCRNGFERMSILCLALLISLSCEKHEYPVVDNQYKVFYAETPSNDTKVYLDDAYDIYWNKGDLISVFRSLQNEKYKFNGQTGEIRNAFVKADDVNPGQAYSRNYAIYPYSSSTISDGDGSFNISFPAEQHYEVNSFGQGSNVMVSATEDSADDVFYFKNVSSYLLLKLYGTDSVRSITLTGNNNEQLSGDVSVCFSGQSISSVIKSGEGGKSIILDCGDSGVALNESVSSPTLFWICVPPTSFDNGFTVKVTNTYGQVLTKVTNKVMDFSSNMVKPMSAFEISLAGKNEITSYSINDGLKEYPAYSITDTLIYISVPNGTDLSNVTPCFETNGISIKVNGVEQESGKGTMDMSDFVNPVRYTVKSTNDEERTYKVVIYDLPVLTVETPNSQPITSKTIWIDEATISLRMPDNELIDLGNTGIKGRGSTSWTQPKKPYALKLNEKRELLGMPSSKRWDLIAAWREGTLLRNDVTYMMGRQTSGLEWTPSGQFVELVLNGVHQGVYYLCEHIKIEKNRLNLTQMDPLTDISGEALTGAYLIEMSYYFSSDDEYTFYTDRLHLGCVMKDPDEDVNPVQLNYIKGYLDNLETMLMDDTRLSAREYTNYLDINSFADYWLVEDLVGNFDSAKPKSTYIYKDRNGKLKAGPLWDFDVYTYEGNTGFVMKDSLYYRALFKEPLFVETVKNKWEGTGSDAGLRNILAPSIVNSYIDTQYHYIRRSALRDREMWPTEGANPDKKLPYDTAVERMKANYKTRYDWFDVAVQSFVVDYSTSGGSNEDYGGQNDDTGGFNFQF